MFPSSTILGNFWTFGFLTEIRQARALQKYWKFSTISNCAKKIFLAKLFVPFIKEVFLHNFRNFSEIWIFDRNSTGADPYKNSENLVLSQSVWRKYFLAKLFVPLIKEVFLHNFRHFLEIWIFDRNSDSRIPYKNSENLVLSQIVWRKYFLANLFVPLIKEVFPHNFRHFLEIRIFDGIQQARTLQKLWKFSTISNCVKKIFFG